MNDRDSKLKKCYFELINCYHKLELSSEAGAIARDLFEKYSRDYLVVFENFKAYLVDGNGTEAERMSGILKELMEEAEEQKEAVNNHYQQSVALLAVSKGNWQEAKDLLSEALQDSPDCLVIMSNLAILNLYLNNIDKCYKDMMLIADKSWVLSRTAEFCA